MSPAKQYIIGHAHIDPVWLWRWQEGYAEVRATYRSALDRIAQFDDFVFTTACAQYYKWIEESEPEMFAEIQKAVADGKWYIVGGMWIQPDCNIPSGESFSRHMLYSQRYFLEKFGVKATVGWNVDSFGHNGNLPQILKKSGIDSYIYMRPDGREYNRPAGGGLGYSHSAYEPFIWKGVDGSAILAYRIPFGYGSNVSDANMEDFKNFALDARQNGQNETMVFYGVGNHGGGPTVKAVQRIHKEDLDCDEVNFVLASPREFFDHVYARLADSELTTLVGDLQHHASGCYASLVKIKELNRRAEQRVTAGEKCAALAQSLLGWEYDRARFTRAWEKIMFNQFHDIMGGCSIKDAYPDVEEFYGESLTLASEGYTRAFQKISWQIDTDKGLRYLSKDNDGRIWEMENKGVPIVVYNPLSWPTRQPVYLEYEDPIGGITDSHGRPVAHQKMDTYNHNGLTAYPVYMFQADVPAMGYTTYWLYKEEQKIAPQPRYVHATSFYIENDFIRVEFDPASGALRSIYDIRAAREFLSAPARPVVCDERELDTWGHIFTRFRNDVGAFENAEITVLEDGPIRARVRVKSFFGRSELTQFYSLYADSTDIEVVNYLFWHEQHKLLKMAFPTTVAAPRALYEIPYGVIEKTPNGMEEPAQAWAAVEGENGVGLAVLNDGHYSYDVKDSELRYTVLRSALYCDHSFGRDENRHRYPVYQEQGEHEFTYIIRPYTEGFGKGHVVRRAAELNSPVVHVIETYHAGKLPQVLSGAEISNENILLAAMKAAEDGNGTIARFYECNGTSGGAEISLPSFNTTFSAQFAPYEIKTFRILDGKATETDITEFEL